MLRDSVAALVVLGLLVCAPVSAQDAAPAPSDPAADLPTVVERAQRYVENSRILERLVNDDGFYPRLGGLNPGSGLAGGAGYRKTLPWVYTDIAGGISTKVYVGADIRARWLQLAGQRFEFWTEYRYRDDTKDPFYGLGLASTPATSTDYGIRTNEFVARAVARPLAWLHVGAELGAFSPNVRSGRDDKRPSTDTLFTDATAPGLTEQPQFIHTGLFAEADDRDAKGFPRRGGFYRIVYTVWNDRTLDRYDFRRFDVEGSQFFPLTATDVIGAHLSLSYTNNAPDSRVPFYLLPSVGGGDTLRSFREFRFRDENAGLFSVELRHQVRSFLHVAGFVDAGKVALHWQDIAPTDLKGSYGVGVRAGTVDRMFFRCDLAAGGDEGVRIFVRLTPAF